MSSFALLPKNLMGISKQMSIQSKILRDLSKYIPQTIIPALIAFISVPIYTRLFDPSSYGNFAIVRVSNEVLKRCSSWFGASLTRYYNVYEKENKLDLMLTTILKTNFLLGLFFSLPALLILKFIEIAPELRLLFQIGIILFAFGLIRQTLTNVLRMQRRINTHSLFVLVSSIFSFLISLTLIFFFNLKIESIFLGNLIMVLIILPFLWRTSVNKNFRIKEQIDFNIIKKFALYGIPLTIGNLGVWVLNLSDRYMLGILLNSHEVGVYSSCYNITWNSLFLIVNLFFMMEEPLAMKIYVNDGKEALRQFINRETRLFFIFIVPCIFLICAYSKFIFSVMVAEEYQKGIIIVPYVAIGVFISGLIYKFHLGILAMEKTKSLMYIVILSGASNILFNILLIPRLGILGAGVATLFSYLFYLAMIVISSKRIFQWPFPFASLFRISFVALISTYPFFCFTTTHNSWPKNAALVFFSIVSYTVLLFVIKEITQDEIVFAKKYLKRLLKR